MSGRFTFLAAALAFAALSASAAPLEEAARPAAEAMFKDGKPPALVIAVVRGGETFISGYGETAPGSKVPPNGQSLVRIASLSKLLTADVLAAMAADGKLALSDTLQDHAPPGRVVPEAKGGGPITLLSLATHTSGLGREAKGDRWAWLAKQTPKTPPETAASYSNVAFDLLGDALATAGEASYPDLLARYTTGPLAMRDTTASPDDEQCRRMIRGGVPARPCADQADMAGAGGVYSTAADMALWLRYQLRQDDPTGEMRRTIGHRIYFRRDALSAADGLDHAGEASGIGLAWILLLPEEGESGAPLLEKTGNIGGFMSYVALVPDREIGVFVAVARPGDPGPAMKAVVKGVNGLARTLAAGP